MQTSHYQCSTSHNAFIFMPLVGAFFIDIINALLLQEMLSLLR
ncbi:hypothetical protein [Comamonas sp. Y33R10-2]|nr:hypothetical protein [Comamonas sp. Y33R10-2]